ncbi:MAG: ATP-binding cassette domain-containing protein, partial [Arenibacter sp.]|nr:ATP-binding cassette domain-containing protein [Arenibacter sp.]
MKNTPSHIALDTKNLSIGYTVKKQQNCIAKDINFTLFKGELASIVGVNGIGKSTLLRTLGNIQPSLAGTILLNNTSLEQHSNKELASEISVVLT